MKVPERLVGFLLFDEMKYPFEFDKETFRLNLFPPDDKTQSKDYCPDKFFYQGDPREHAVL